MVTMYWADTPERHTYFEGQFFALLKVLARRQGTSVSVVLKELKNFQSFKDFLEASYSQDPSLLNFLDSMTNENKREFFERPRIQAIVENNLADEEPLSKQQILDIPVRIEQVKKEPRKFFNATVRGKRTRAYLDKIKVRGKQRNVLRSPSGRFAKRT